MSDLKKFLDLYKSWGIELKIEKEDNGDQVVKIDVLELEEKCPGKIRGYPGFHTLLVFNHSGKFSCQGIWE